MSNEATMSNGRSRAGSGLPNATAESQAEVPDADVSYRLPRPSKEMVDELNARSPAAAEFDALDG